MKVNMPEKNPPKLKSVQEILDGEEKFFVPAYQRGYRWTPAEVKLLIDDIDQYGKEEGDKASSERCPFYSLQAVIVKRKDDLYEVIDGQQRLTTTLIILQALYIVKNKKMMNLMLKAEDYDGLKLENGFSIKYETRKDSEEWLVDITKAYFVDEMNGNEEEKDKLKNQNSDYHHFINALICAVEEISKMSDKGINEFSGLLQENVRFIWYDVTDDESSNEIEVFDRINATKIRLNNAELIKALFLQQAVFKDHSFDRNQMAVEWDELEKRLQNPSFWFFIYSQNKSTFSYETHVEYLFDLIKGKTDADKDNYYYTFNAYYAKFLEAVDKYDYVKEAWNEIHELYSLLEEWYNDKEDYHYIGYLIEYGKDENSRPIQIPYLKESLKNLQKTKVHDKLVEMIKMSLKDLKSEKLVYGKPELTQVLFLFNIETEQQRKNAEARFSFSNYKELVWNQEHIASHIDYRAKMKERVELALDLLEYFTGEKSDVKKLQTDQEKLDEYWERILDKLPENEKERALCEKIKLLLDEKMTENRIEEVFESIMSYFDSSKPLLEVVSYKKKNYSEKDFIWNFVLLNEHTNKSYGNHLFPVKRRRILNDEFGVYTPITTRYVFEKTYSKKLIEMMKWGRDDAFAYWEEMCSKLKAFLPEGFALPPYIKY